MLSLQHPRRALALAACVLLVLSALVVGCRPSPPPAGAAAAPVIEEWSVSPTQVPPGGVVTIRWRVSGVERVTIEPFGELAASGQIQDAPQATLRYTLTATNAQGTAQRSQEVLVGEAAPAPTTAAAEPPSATPEAPTATPEPPTATATPEPPTPTATIGMPALTLLPPAITLLPPPLLETATPTATPGPTWQHPVTLGDKRSVYHLRLTGAGQIRARATWSGTQAELALIVNGPGKVGAYARKDGTSPLEVVYNVTEADFAAGDEWRVTVASFGGGQASGMIEITYPSGSSVSPFSNDFVVKPGYGSAVSVIVLRRLTSTSGGTISGKATWSGSPANLALIINGPGMVGYYARKDGPSPLSAQYEATADDLSHGDTWRVSLTSFVAPNAQGQIELSYPYIWIRPIGPIILPTLVSP